ncbi:hypothetical protein ACTXT7_004175 [Hymenolepis weldensis]
MVDVEISGKDMMVPNEDILNIFSTHRIQVESAITKLTNRTSNITRLCNHLRTIGHPPACTPLTESINAHNLPRPCEEKPSQEPMVNAYAMKLRYDSPIGDMPSICTCESCINDYLYVYEKRNVAGLLSLPVSPSEASREVGEDFYFWLQQKYTITVHSHRLDRPFDSPGEIPPNNCIWGVTESAKVRFTCVDCGKVWTSISALASFALCLENEDGQQRWVLWFSLHGQTCSDCASDGSPPKLHYGTWYPHEVFRVMKNVHCKIEREVFNQMTV